MKDPTSPQPPQSKARRRKSAESRFTKAARAEAELKKLEARVFAAEKKHHEAARELRDYIESLPAEVRDLLGLDALAKKDVSALTPAAPGKDA